MIVKWPGVVKANTLSDQYVIVKDFFPSILEIVGVKNYNIAQQVDGKSFVLQLIRVIKIVAEAWCGIFLISGNQKMGPGLIIFINLPYGKAIGNSFIICVTELRSCITCNMMMGSYTIWPPLKRKRRMHWQSFLQTSCANGKL